MACYECGAEETPDGKLCQECTRKRLEKKRQMVESENRENGPEESALDLGFFKQYRQELLITYFFLCLIFVAIIIRLIPGNNKIYVMSPDATAPKVISYCKEHLSLKFLTSVGASDSEALTIEESLKSQSIGLSALAEAYCQKFGDACAADYRDNSCQAILRMMPEEER